MGRERWAERTCWLLIRHFTHKKICFIPEQCNYTWCAMMSLFLQSYISTGLCSVPWCRVCVARTAVRPRSLSQKLFPASVRWNQTALKAVNNIHQQGPFQAPAFQPFFLCLICISFATSIERDETQGFSSLAKSKMRKRVKSGYICDREPSQFRGLRLVLIWPSRTTGNSFAIQVKSSEVAVGLQMKTGPLIPQATCLLRIWQDEFRAVALWGRFCIHCERKPWRSFMFWNGWSKILVFWVNAFVIVARGWQDSKRCEKE